MASRDRESRLRSSFARVIASTLLASAATTMACTDAPPAAACAGDAYLPTTFTVDAGVETSPGTFFDCAKVCDQAFAEKNPNCGHSGATCTVEAGVVTCGYQPPMGGRRPEGYTSSGLYPRGDALETLASLANLEAASVHAFARMRRELRAFGAPRALLRRCSRARRDEIRHARIVGALSRRRRSVIMVDPKTLLATRELRAFAEENAVEGCVRETFGALLATYQGMHARDPHVRAAMKRIARDETRHAALAHTVASWLRSRMSAGDWHHIDRARAAAVVAVRAEISSMPSSLDFALGLPGREAACALVDRLFDSDRWNFR
jgi:hypothetical protein